MAIYRGAGGAGDATGDSASEALLVRELAAEVQRDADATEAARVAALAAQAAAETAETNAETAETNAETAATNAAASAASASSSASTATTQAGIATTQATNASNSATAAASSASNASTSATNAASSASAAATSATNANNSANAASASATSASNSATSASTSASTATTQATNAATSATNAASSATSASTSASTATTQAGIATTQATNASNSASAAATSATNASNSASAAATSATNASNSASAASTSATNASNSATSAATSATNAANSATAASGFADDASDSADAAAASAASINQASIAITGGSINGTTIGASTASTGAFTSLSSSGAFSANGGATLGDASGDALTINSSTVSVPNGLNFDSDTLVIDATNNRVGIGTASPSRTLHIAGLTYSSTGGFSVGDGTSFTPSGLNLIPNYGVGHVSSLSTSTIAGFGGLNFYTGQLQRVRIDQSGNVGIGTNSPDSPLHVEGQTKIGVSTNPVRINSSSTTGIVEFSSTSNVIRTLGATPLILESNSVERVRVSSTGNVTLPYQPAFSGSPNATVNATNKVTSYASTRTRGGMSFSSGVITVPVAGEYGVLVNAITNGSSALTFSIRKNGTTVFSSLIDSGTFRTCAGLHVVQMSANDYLELWVDSGTMHDDSNYNKVSVFLLG
jgi:hypothetical protein